ncbi:trimeric LpxA-like protein [Tuber borchii]|uniref:Trimeric LpxA-like protein n=1 Tax=Tuber borchii TaxID=42251 RepID=A0A2T6ZD54_TUBBO|nr:trimeric LpxA-like protein [Tuber borchii]
MAGDGMRRPEYGVPITIEHCYLPGNVIVLPGVRIGRASTVSVGSVVKEDVPPGCLVAGNPARVIWVIDKDAVECFQRAGGRRALEITRPKVPSAGEDDIKGLMQRLQRLEVEVREVKEELKRRME